MHERATSIYWCACQWGLLTKGALRRHLHVGLQLEGTTVVLRTLRGVPMVNDLGLLGGHLAPCRAAEMGGSEVASPNLGWRKRWTPSCIVNSRPSTHLGKTPTGGVHLGRPNHHGKNSYVVGAGVEHPIPDTRIHGESEPGKGEGKYELLQQALSKCITIYRAQSARFAAYVQAR